MIGLGGRGSLAGSDASATCAKTSDILVFTGPNSLAIETIFVVIIAAPMP
ncbi:MAG: hypothetical protein WCG32_02560 [Actinomycetes bacterium]